MKITINVKKIPIIVWLPTTLLKKKIFLKMAHLEAYYESIDCLYKELKRHIKENGHFVLVDIEVENDTKIKIKV